MDRMDSELYYDGDGVDLPRIRLTPSRGGNECLGNGEHNDIAVEIRCDECNFQMECFPEDLIQSLEWNADYGKRLCESIDLYREKNRERE